MIHIKYKQIDVTYGNIIFYSGLFLLCVRSLLNASSVIDVSYRFDRGLLLISLMVLIASSFVGKTMKLSRILLFVILYSMACITAVKAGNTYMLIFIVAIISASDYELDDILKFVLMIQATFFIFNLLVAILKLYLVGESMVMVINGVSRIHLGFGHPNRVSMYLLNMILIYIWFRFNNFNFTDGLIVILFEIISFVITGTKTSVILVMVILLLIEMSKNKKTKQLIISLSQFIFPLCFLSMFILCKLYLVGNEFAKMLDKLSTNRVETCSYGLSHYGISFFGQNVEFNEKIYSSKWNISTFTFDNLFMVTGVNEGIIYIILISFALFLVAKSKDVRKAVFVIVWCLLGFSEVHGLDVIMFTPILLISCIFDYKKEDVYEKNFSVRIK